MKTIIDKANTRGYFNHGWAHPINQGENSLIL